MWELDYEESWAPKNWCFQIVALEKTLESPLDCKEIKPVNPKGNQSWVFIGRTNAEADAKNWLIGKDPDGGKDWETGGEGGDRGTSDWMASLTQWTWVWGKSGRWWRTRKPSVLQNIGSQRIRYNWATERQKSHFPVMLTLGQKFSSSGI